MKDIAKRCGVSTATVSKALNGQPDIGEETRERILRTADELGYMANASARALKTKRSYDIGVLFVDPMHGGLAHEFFSTMLDGIRREAEKHGYDITFINSSVGQRQTSYLQHCRYRGLDGVVIASADYFDPMVAELVQSELPVVTVDHVFNNRISVVSDNLVGMDALVRYVYGKGHRKIALIHGEVTSVTRNRLTGFHRACEELGLTVPEKWMRRGVFHDPKGCYQITKELLSQSEIPTCIFFPDDYSYIGGYNAITEAGLRIPEDISVVGYDGIPLSRIISPVLTTWRQDADGLGTVATARLIEQIEHPRTVILDRVIVTGQLQKGGSVKQID